MSNIVHKLSASEVNQLIKRLDFETSNLPQGMKAKLKYKGTVISIYNSNKVMFQGSNAESTANELLPHVSSNNTTKSSSSTKSSTKKSATHQPFNKYNCIGSDEAGSGDYFGPLTVCAAYVSKEHCQVLKTLGVDDSKKLTDTKIVELAEQLVTFIPHSLLTLDNKNYNIKQASGWSQVKMKAVLHNEAIKNVTAKIETDALDYIVIDQFAEPNVYKRYALTQLPFEERTCFETKGESKSLAIAAASIISRYAFVKNMDHLSKKLNTTLPKGASNKVDLSAAKIIERWDINVLDDITKKHFANRNKALALVNKKHN